MYLAILLIPVISGFEVKPCKDAKYYIFNDANFTYHEAQTSCGFIPDTALTSEQRVIDLYSCEPNLLDNKMFWVRGHPGHCTVMSFHNGLSSTYSGGPCDERFPIICCEPTSQTTTIPPVDDMPSVDHMDITESSTTHWETFARNNSFIHVVKEGLSQKSAILGCKQWFNGSLLQMSLEELFLDLSNITLHGHYWIDDIEDSNLTDDCLVLSRLNNGTSITAMYCEEKHYSICQSIADTDQLLNNDFFEAILRELTVHKNETGKGFHSKISAWDSRVTAHIVGGSGIIFMIIFSVIVGLFDLPYFKNFIRYIVNRYKNN